MSLDVRLVALAVQACPAVAGLHSGADGENVTYLREGRLIGIRVGDGQITVGVVGRFPAGVAEIAAQVRAAVATHAPDLVVIVNVEDMFVPEPPPSDRGGTGP